MTRTFTLPTNIQKHQDPAGEASLSGPDQNRAFPSLPSAECINNILNFSKNLEISPSKHVGHLVYLKS